MTGLLHSGQNIWKLSNCVPVVLDGVGRECIGTKPFLNKIQTLHRVLLCITPFNFSFPANNLIPINAKLMHKLNNQFRIWKKKKEILWAPSVGNILVNWRCLNKKGFLSIVKAKRTWITSHKKLAVLKQRYPLLLHITATVMTLVSQLWN